MMTRYRKDLVEECTDAMTEFVKTLGEALEINQAVIKPDQVQQHYYPK